MPDRRVETDQNAMQVARAYEEHRGASVTDVSYHPLRPDIIREALVEIGVGDHQGASCDLISRRDGETRLIEVKGRSTGGPVDVPGSELDTLSSAGHCGWLYIVWNALRPEWPIELRTISSAGGLPWREDRTGSQSERPRRTQTRYRLETDDIRAAAEPVDLSDVPGLPDKSGQRLIG